MKSLNLPYAQLNYLNTKLGWWARPSIVKRSYRGCLFSFWQSSWSIEIGVALFTWAGPFWPGTIFGFNCWAPKYPLSRILLMIEGRISLTDCPWNWIWLFTRKPRTRWKVLTYRPWSIRWCINSVHHSEPFYLFYFNTILEIYNNSRNVVPPSESGRHLKEKKSAQYRLIGMQAETQCSLDGKSNEEK